MVHPRDVASGLMLIDILRPSTQYRHLPSNQQSSDHQMLILFEADVSTPFVMHI